MPRHPYEILADFLKNAHGFCAAESELISPVAPGSDYPVFQPVCRLEASLAKSGGWCLHFWGEYGERTSGMKPPAHPVEVRREINLIGEIIKSRMTVWGWRYVLTPQGMEEVNIRIDTHQKSHYYPLLDAALSWRLGRKVEDHGTADGLANEAERLNITPTMTPEEGKRVIWDRHRQWYMSPALAETRPSIAFEDHAELLSSCEKLSAYHARYLSPSELISHQHKLESVVRETPHELAQAGHGPDVMRESDPQQRHPTRTSWTEASMIKVLFLAANPLDTNSLRLGEEAREIKERIQLSDLRDQFAFEQEHAVRVADLQRHLLHHQPHIVHFSGHGSTSGKIILENGQGRSVELSSSALKALFAVLKDNIRCVVLNACYSDAQGTGIAESIECVVGMGRAVNDGSAIAFASSFYQGLGHGRSIQTAFDLGRIQIDISGLPGKDIPTIRTRHGVDASSVYLLGGGTIT
jgi:hypothetical protein